MSQKIQPSSVGAGKAGSHGAADIKEWNVEDNTFWESNGKSIANRNLWISIPKSAVRFCRMVDVEHDHGADAQCRFSL